jgi:hypothetical protein
MTNAAAAGPAFSRTCNVAAAALHPLHASASARTPQAAPANRLGEFVVTNGSTTSCTSSGM